MHRGSPRFSMESSSIFFEIKVTRLKAVMKSKVSFSAKKMLQVYWKLVPVLYCHDALVAAFTTEWSAGHGLILMNKPESMRDLVPIWILKTCSVPFMAWGWFGPWFLANFQSHLTSDFLAWSNSPWKQSRYVRDMGIHGFRGSNRCGQPNLACSSNRFGWPLAENMVKAPAGAGSWFLGRKAPAGPWFLVITCCSLPPKNHESLCHKHTLTAFVENRSNPIAPTRRPMPMTLLSDQKLWLPCAQRARLVARLVRGWVQISISTTACWEISRSVASSITGDIKPIWLPAPVTIAGVDKPPCFAVWASLQGVDISSFTCTYSVHIWNKYVRIRTGGISTYLCTYFRVRIICIYVQIWNPTPLRMRMYFVRIYVHRYIQILTIWAMVSVSCTYNTHKYEQYGIYSDGIRPVHIHMYFVRIYVQRYVYMCIGVRILYVLYVLIRPIRKTYNTYKIIRTNIRTKYVHKNRYIYTYRIRHVCRQNEPAWEGPMGSGVRSTSRPVSEL